MDQRVVVHASSLCFYVFFAAAALGCSSVKPNVAFAVKESAIAEVTSPLTFEPAVPAPAAAPAAPAKSEPPARNVDDVLAGCQADGKKCVVSPEDAEEICRGMTPTVALHVFANNKRLRVGFLTRDMETWSTAHVHSTKSLARFDEEVIVLAKRKSKSSVVVQGAALTYEVLRWDGSCASLMGDEITFRRPPHPVRPLNAAATRGARLGL